MHEAMSLEQDIRNWDGKSSSDIDDVYHRYANEDGFVVTIIQLSKCEVLQKGATWLLKRYVENGQKEIETAELTKIFKQLLKLRRWEAKLHLLQCLPFMRIAGTEKKLVESFLRACLTDNNKFVRAWAYNGFYELASQYPEYKNEEKQIFDMALRCEAPSVTAGIRNILKKGF